ncbi:MAG: hypothetical protein AAFY98_12460, partial [Verrucomicrobiota bacterium]
MIFGGYEFTEIKTKLEDLEELEADVAVFLAGWEPRSFSIIETQKVRSRKSILLRFSDDNLSVTELESFKEKMRSSSEEVNEYSLGSSLDRTQWEAGLTSLVAEISLDDRILTCFVDYTSIPKAVTQTMYRMLLRQSSFPRTIWGYCEGIYSHVNGNARIDQGIQGGFFPIRFTPGKGGTSGERAAVLALGADEKLVEELLEGSVYDRIHVLTANSSTASDLDSFAALQKQRLIRELHIPDYCFHE